MALEVGIVGLPGAGKTSLFNALTRAGAQAHDQKEHVGMAPIADERLPPVAAVESSRKVTPAAIRVVDVPGTGPQLLGNLRQVDALLMVVREPGPARGASSSSCWSPTATTSSAGSSACGSRRNPATRSCARRSIELEQLLAHVEAAERSPTTRASCRPSSTC